LEGKGKQTTKFMTSSQIPIHAASQMTRQKYMQEREKRERYQRKTSITVKEKRVVLLFSA
jgi:hypothetical protein